MRSYMTRVITVISFCIIRKCMATGKGESNSYPKAVYWSPMQPFNYEQHSPKLWLSLLLGDSRCIEKKIV